MITHTHTLERGFRVGTDREISLLTDRKNFPLFTGNGKISLICSPAHALDPTSSDAHQEQVRAVIRGIRQVATAYDSRLDTFMESQEQVPFASSLKIKNECCLAQRVQLNSGQSRITRCRATFSIVK
jgi:hypothetical protein